MIAEILVRVSFLKHTLIKSDAGVVEGDYNTTKLVFEFEEDVSGKRIVFKMSNPEGELIFLTDLKDNAVLLVGKDENGYDCSLFPAYGLYSFELVLYDNGKLTSAPGWMNVTKSHVTIEDSVVKEYLPAFDKLVNLDIVHETGDSEKVVMSQKAITEEINNLYAKIDSLHPAIMEYISMMPYLEENDATNINLLLQKGKKFHFTGNWRTTNLYDGCGELPWEVVEAFGWVNFAWEWTPDTVPSFNGGSSVGNISNFTASLDYTGYTLISASASRMMVSFSCYDDGNGGYSVSVDFELAIEVVIKEDSTGTEYTCTYGYIYWDYHKNEYYEGRGDGCLNYVESYIEKTPETAHFFPSTLDFRTQSLDRRLTVALEEAIEKRRAEFNAKHNAEEGYSEQ